VHFQKIQTKENEWFTEVIEPAFSHGICYNAAVAIIADADDGKSSELIIGTSSREILTYGLGTFFFCNFIIQYLTCSKNRTKSRYFVFATEAKISAV
jgi:hypothetical protein